MAKEKEQADDKQPVLVPDEETLQKDAPVKIYE
jgi:hypothetical protein